MFSNNISGLNNNKTTKNNSTNNDNLFDDIFTFSNTKNSTAPNNNSNNNNNSSTNKTFVDPFASFVSMTKKTSSPVSGSNMSLNSLKEQQDLQNSNNKTINSKTNQQWNFDLFEKQTSSKNNSFGSFSSLNSKNSSSSNINNITNNTNTNTTTTTTNDNILFEFDYLSKPASTTTNNTTSLLNTTTTTTTTTTNNNNNASFANFSNNNNNDNNLNKNSRKTNLSSSSDLFNFNIQPASKTRRKNSYSDSDSNGSEDRFMDLNDNLIDNDKSFPLNDKTHFERINIEKLIEMGFKEKDAIEAVKATENNLEEAVQYVLNKQGGNEPNSNKISPKNSSASINNNDTATAAATTTTSNDNNNNNASGSGSNTPSRFASLYHKASGIFKQSRDKLNSLVNSEFNSENSSSNEKVNESKSPKQNDKTTTKDKQKKNEDEFRNKRFSVEYYYQEDGDEDDDDILLPNPEDFTRYKHVEINDDDASPDIMDSINDITTKPKENTEPSKDDNKNESKNNLSENVVQAKPKKKVRESANSSDNSSVSSVYNNPDDFVRYRHLEMTNLSPVNNNTSSLMVSTNDEHDQNIDKLMEVFSTTTIASPTKDGFESTQMMVPPSNNNNNNNNNNNLISDVYVAPEKQQQAQRYREIGNEFFKKGQFSDAASQYTLAIQELPQGHSDLIPIYNNRSIAYIKTGHYKECVNDCNIVQSMDSKDVKSLIRRATAYEHLEKWKLALADYQKIQTLDSSYTIANQAITRCKKALHVEANDGNPSFVPTKSKSTSSTPNRVNR